MAGGGAKEPAARYRSLAGECRKFANTLSTPSARKTALEMAEEWDRLADQYSNSAPPFLQPGARFLQPGAPEQTIMQQQQVQPKDEDKS